MTLDEHLDVRHRPGTGATAALQIEDHVLSADLINPDQVRAALQLEAKTER